MTDRAEADPEPIAEISPLSGFVTLGWIMFMLGIVVWWWGYGVMTEQPAEDPYLITQDPFNILGFVAYGPILVGGWVFYESLQRIVKRIEDLVRSNQDYIRARLAAAGLIGAALWAIGTFISGIDDFDLSRPVSQLAGLVFVSYCLPGCATIWLMRWTSESVCELRAYQIFITSLIISVLTVAAVFIFAGVAVSWESLAIFLIGFVSCGWLQTAREPRGYR